MSRKYKDKKYFKKILLPLLAFMKILYCEISDNGPCANTLHTLSYSFLTKAQWDGGCIKIISILLMKKLRFAEVEYCPRSYS